MTERKFGEGGGGERNEPRMRDGEFYDLDSPFIVGGRKFTRVQCEYRVTYRVQPTSHEYVVRGIPEGGTEPESFVLRFTNRGVKVTPAHEKTFTVVAPTRPPLRLIKGGNGKPN